MGVAEILARCGMSADDVRKAAEKHMKPVSAPTMTLAEQNEQKYADVETEEDRWEKTHGGVYREIQAGTDNGTCTTRKGTYRHQKTGDGRCATMEDVRIRREIDRRAKRNSDGRFSSKGAK